MGLGFVLEKLNSDEYREMFFILTLSNELKGFVTKIFNEIDKLNTNKHMDSKDTIDLNKCLFMISQ